MKRILFVFIIAFSPLLILSQSARQDAYPFYKWPIAALRADYKLMRSALEALHPGLYWYTPKQKMDSVFDVGYQAINKPMTETEFMYYLYPVIRQIRCGHTQLEHSVAFRNSPNRPRTVHLPFDVFVRDNRGWIISVKSGVTGLPIGSEVIAVNDMSMKQLIEEGVSIWNADGYNRTWNEFFLNEYNSFEEVCSGVHNWKSPYKLRIKDTTGFEKTVMIINKELPKLPDEKMSTPVELSKEEKEKLAHEQEQVHKRSYLNLRFLPDSISALLEVNALEYEDQKFYADAFRKIGEKNVQHLILDIRRNHGGDVRIISNLLSYLADSDYVILSRVIANVSDPGRNKFSNDFDNDINRSYYATFKGSRKAGSFYEFEFVPEMGKIVGFNNVAGHDRFRGKLYVLIGGGTFSNASNFAAAVKEQCKKAVFIGRETGGTKAGCGGGTNNKLTLPNTKLVLQMPWMRLVSATPDNNDGRGLMPDYPVQITPKAILVHKDEDLEKALELIKLAE